ncbi:HLA class II histocompatibility antigen DRB1-15 beta chain-like [Crotalus adamanteus]|uniref:HLA class II histocompatibility antigen DRB1-15 beta chain-like n=1 Tax=Crotalus adamanteus TaxID=8729 RepID=A0AAW1BSM3_CROAD
MNHFLAFIVVQAWQIKFHLLHGFLSHRLPFPTPPLANGIPPLGDTGNDGPAVPPDGLLPPPPPFQPISCSSQSPGAASSTGRAHLLFQHKCEWDLDGTQRVRYLECYIYDQEEFACSDSAHGEFLAVTALVQVNVDMWNREECILQYEKARVDVCLYNCRLLYYEAAKMQQRVTGRRGQLSTFSRWPPLSTSPSPDFGFMRNLSFALMFSVDSLAWTSTLSSPWEKICQRSSPLQRSCPTPTDPHLKKGRRERNSGQGNRFPPSFSSFAAASFPEERLHLGKTEAG